MKGGAITVLFQNVHGMPTNKQNRHKLPEFEKHINEDVNVL